jgi:bifunctional DNase/RNase
VGGKKDGIMKLVEAKIEGLALDMTTKSPVVILSPIGMEKVLPIWIGQAEAMGIAMVLSGVQSKRPMTHDLLKEILSALNTELSRVEITELKEETFHARLMLKSNGREFQIDARPSDSIALALRTNSKIFVSEELFKIASQDRPDTTTLPTDPETLRERLKKINPEDFGKYSL